MLNLYSLSFSSLCHSCCVWCHWQRGHWGSWAALGRAGFDHYVGDGSDRPVWGQRAGFGEQSGAPYLQALLCWLYVALQLDQRGADQSSPHCLQLPANLFGGKTSVKMLNWHESVTFAQKSCIKTQQWAKWDMQMLRHANHSDEVYFIISQNWCKKKVIWMVISSRVLEVWKSCTKTAWACQDHKLISPEVCVTSDFEDPSEHSCSWMASTLHTDDIMMFADAPVKWPVRAVLWCHGRWICKPE